MVTPSTCCSFHATIIILASLTVFCNCYDNQTYDVIIIGAGASGIAAGVYLLSSGVDNFVILEAENRIGGRIYTTGFGNACVDLGAEWCLGEADNKVYSIAADYEILKPVKEYTFMSTERSYYIDNTKRELLECRRNFSNIYHGYISDVIDDYFTLGEMFNIYFSEKIFEPYMEGNPRTPNRTAEFCWDHFNALSSLALAPESFYSWDDIPAKHNYRKCLGNLQHFNGLGFHVILKMMMNEFPNFTEHSRIHSMIRYYSEVQKIIWSQENTSEVIVKSTSGDYIGKHVIFTPSLGVLKNMHYTLFEPSLPQSKINAINCLGFEGTMKVFMKFPKPWWSPDEEFQPTILVINTPQRVALEDELIKERTPYQKLLLPPCVFTKSPWLLALKQLLPSPNNPTVLEAWFTGEMTKAIETLPDEILINGIMLVLNHIYVGLPYLDIPKIDRPSILRSYWNSNPHFLGSHSYETRNKPTPFSGSCNVDLATPLYNRNNTPVVLFAGEATNKHHYSTVHGAIDAGEREAQRLISLVFDEGRRFRHAFRMYN